MTGAQDAAATHEPPVVGILGGMGPLATADFLTKLTTLTPADHEAGHLTVAIWSNPRIPDRTRALRGLGPSPVNAMADGVRALLLLGASLIAVPCNTAHAFLPDVQARTGARFVDMIDATVARVAGEYPDASRIGILSTEGTQLAGLYRRACDRSGLIAVEPSTDVQQACLDRAIALVKTGGDLQRAASLVAQAAHHLADRGAEAVILGCTELPIISQQVTQFLPVVDATDSLARAVVRAALGLSVPAERLRQC